MDEELPATLRSRRDAAWRLIEPLVRAQPETFLEQPRAALVAEIVAQGKTSRFTLYRLLRRYWQRGMTPNALIPGLRQQRRARQGQGGLRQETRRPGDPWS